MAYRGNYPHRIALVSSAWRDGSGRSRGTVRVVANDGESFMVHASDTAGRMPKIGEEIGQYRKPAQTDNKGA